MFEEIYRSRHFREPLHVMLVEDDKLTHRMVKFLLKDEYRLITARDADEAVANYLLHAPDIVFLDINLPDHNGFSVLRALRKCDPQAYIVMFSANGYMENILQAMNTGAEGFITKPFRKEQLLHYIRNCSLTRDTSSASQY